jgi:S1-C subfamily serine protease
MIFERHITIRWLGCVVLTTCAGAIGQAVPQTQPSSNALITTENSTSAPTTRPLFEELNRETQSLFKQVSASVVRVQLPSGNRTVFSADDPLAKWGARLDPQMRQRLDEMLRRSPENIFVRTDIHPTTSPSTNESPFNSAGANDGPHIYLLQLNRFTPNSIGVVIDDEQHILVSRFVDKSAFSGPVPLVFPDGRLATANFVASDRQSDLTVLKLQGVKGTPATFSEDMPPGGTLLLVMSLNPAMNRLAVWEGWEPDIAALVNIDGKIAGFSKGGQFMSASASQPAVHDLITHGFVQRAVLGVVVQVVEMNDPQRAADTTLGSSPALRVRDVVDGSAAQRAGLQKGDLILTFASQSVGDIAALATAIASRRGPTPMTVLREGERQTIRVDLQGP